MNSSTKPGVFPCRARTELKHFTTPLFRPMSSPQIFYPSLTPRPIRSCAVCLPAAAPQSWRVNLDFWILLSVAHQLILLWRPKLKHLIVMMMMRRSRVFILSVSEKKLNCKRHLLAKVCSRALTWGPCPFVACGDLGLQLFLRSGQHLAALRCHREGVRWGEGCNLNTSFSVGPKKTITNAESRYCDEGTTFAGVFP